MDEQRKAASTPALCSTFTFSVQDKRLCFISQHVFQPLFEFSHFQHTHTHIGSKPLAQVSKSHRKKTGKKYPGSCFFLLLGQAGCFTVHFPVVIFHHHHWPGWFLHWSHSTYACMFFFFCQAVLNYIVGRSDVKCPREHSSNLSGCAYVDFVDKGGCGHMLMRCKWILGYEVMAKCGRHSTPCLSFRLHHEMSWNRDLLAFSVCDPEIEKAGRRGCMSGDAFHPSWWEVFNCRLWISAWKDLRYTKANATEISARTSHYVKIQMSCKLAAVVCNKRPYSAADR